MIRLYLLLFIIGTVGSVGYGGYRYVTNLQQQVETLKENNLVLEQAVATNQETIDRMAAEATRNAELQAQLTTRLQVANASVNNLRSRLSQINITQEALNDPADMEQRINRAVQRLILNILEETGGEVPDSTDSTPSAQ